MPRTLRTLMLVILMGSQALATLHAQEAEQEPQAESAASEPALVSADMSTAQLADLLIDANLGAKAGIIDLLARRPDPGVRRTLAALLDGTLNARKSDRRLVVATPAGGGVELVDALGGEELGAGSAGELTRIGTNNSLRRSLRGALARLDLADPDEKVRLAAVAELMRTVDEDTLAILRERLPAETDEDVRERMEAGIALGDLGSSDAALRLAAINRLQDSLNPEVFNRLTALTAVGEDGTPAEADAAVRAAAEEALSGIRSWRSFFGFIETIFFGLSLGSVLMLAGIGLAITFGVMGVINMAHGELMMLGAYSVFVVQQLLPDSIGSSVLLAIPLAFLVSGLMGVLIERTVVRFLYGRPLETLLATFGVSLILQQLVRDVFSPNNRPVETPAWMAGSLQVNEVLSITYTRLYIIVFALLVFFLLMLVLRRTRLGLEVRAVSQNRAMARAMGIRTEWVDAMAFGLGSGIAGVAGVALSQLTNVGPNLGQSYIVDSFMVVVFGGVGSLWGTQISGLSLGVASKLLEPHAGAVLAKIIVLVGLILFIQRRPRGLFPQRGRAAES